MINMDQGKKMNKDVGLEEGDNVSIFFREKQGEIMIKWEGDTPVLTVFLTDNDGVAPEPDGLFRFINETTEEAKFYVKKHGQ